MRTEIASGVVVAAGWLAACTGIAGLDEFEVVTGGAGTTLSDGGGGAGGTPGGGGAGGDAGGGHATGGDGGNTTGGGGAGGSTASECTAPENCPQPSEPCRHATCIALQCGEALDSLGDPCDANGGDECDGQGSCLSSLGRNCAQNGHCVTDHCVDGVCCESTCDGLCEACNGTTPGSCEPTAAGSGAGDDCAPDGVCDGTGACATGAALWSKAFGDSAAQWAGAAAVDATDHVLLAGLLEGTADFGGGPRTSNGEDIFAAKLDADGNHVWSRVLVAADDQRALAAAATSGGDLVVTGFMKGTVDFDGHSVTSDGNMSIFVAKLDAAAGTASWAPDFVESNDEQDGHAVAVAADDSVILTGKYKGTVDFGNGATLSDSGGRFRVFVVRFAPNGLAQWAASYGSSAADSSGNAVALDAQGNIWLAGEFASTIDFGGSVLTAAGGTDVFVAKLAAGGAHIWSNRFGDSANQRATALTTDSADVVVAGSFRGTMDFGTGALSAGGRDDAFLARLGPDGQAQWSARFGDAGSDQFATAVACAADGMIAVTGRFRGTMDFGGHVVTSTAGGKDDVFVARISPSGTPLWARGFGNGAQDVAGNGVALDSVDRTLLAGMINSSVDFGNGAIGGFGGPDIFVAKLDR